MLLLTLFAALLISLTIEEINPWLEALLVGVIVLVVLLESCRVDEEAVEVLELEVGPIDALIDKAMVVLDDKILLILLAALLKSLTIEEMNP